MKSLLSGFELPRTQMQFLQQLPVTEEIHPTKTSFDKTKHIYRQVIQVYINP